MKRYLIIFLASFILLMLFLPIPYKYKVCIQYNEENIKSDECRGSVKLFYGINFIYENLNHNGQWDYFNNYFIPKSTIIWLLALSLIISIVLTIVILIISKRKLK